MHDPHAHTDMRVQRTHHTCAVPADKCPQDLICLVGIHWCARGTFPRRIVMHGFCEYCEPGAGRQGRAAVVGVKFCDVSPCIQATGVTRGTAMATKRQRSTLTQGVHTPHPTTLRCVDRGSVVHYCSTCRLLPLLPLQYLQLAMGCYHGCLERPGGSHHAYMHRAPGNPEQHAWTGVVLGRLLLLRVTHDLPRGRHRRGPAVAAATCARRMITWPQYKRSGKR